MITEKYIERLY